MAFSFKRFIKGILLKPSSSNDTTEKGDLQVTDSDSKLNYHNGTTSSPITTEAHTATLTNKTIDGDNNTISNLDHGSEVDNPSSGVHGVTGNVVGTTDSQSLTNKTIDGDNNTLSNLDHGAEVDNPSSGVHGVTGSVVGTTDSQSLTNKTIDGDNNTISNLAHGAEVDNPSSGVHGVTGSVVGTTDTQALTGKDIDGGTASDTSRITVPSDTKANLDLLTRKEGTIVYGTDTDILYADDGTTLNDVGGGGGGDADAIHDNVPAEITAITPKTAPASADEIILEDSADSDNKKAMTMGNLLDNALVNDQAALHTDVAAEITAVTPKTVPVTADEFLMEDSAAADAKKAITAGNLLDNALVNDQDAFHTDVASEISGLTAKATPTTSDLLVIEDVADSNNKKKITIGDLPSSGGSAFDPATTMRIYDDFITGESTSGQIGSLGWTLGTSSASFNLVSGIAGHPGIVSLATGTVLNGYSSIHLGTGSISPVIASGNATNFECCVSEVSNGDNVFKRQNIGLGDDINGPDQTNGIYFEHRNSSPNWRLISVSGGTKTDRDTGISVSTSTYYKLRWEINSAGTSIQAYVDGVSAGAAITTNIPTGALIPLVQCVGDGAGGTNHQLHVDYYYLEQTVSR